MEEEWQEKKICQKAEWLGAVCLAGLLSTGTAFAAEPQAGSQDTPTQAAMVQTKAGETTTAGQAKQEKAAEPARRVDTTVTIEGVQRHFNYVETENGAGLDSERGHIRGYAVSIGQQNMKSKQYWKIRYEQLSGSTVYDGHYLAAPYAPVLSRSSEFIEDLEAIYGVPVSRDKKQSVYLGIGWHKWQRGVGYDETYEWGYVPIGYRYEFLQKKKFQMAVDVSAKIMFSGRLIVASDGDSIQLKIGNRPGLRIELPMTYRMDEHWGLSLTPWYEYFQLGKSPIFLSAEGGIEEPASTNRQYGVNIGLQYHF